ncbi:MAG: HAD family hydrolase, partial [Spirochaetota bacterium]
GVPVVMITAQNTVIAGCFSRYLGMADVIGNSFISDGKSFGKAVEPYSLREGKTELAGEYAQRKGIALSQCSFYSDSLNDIPLLSAVGAPVAVNPGAFLEKEALRNGWKIVRFDR